MPSFMNRPASPGHREECLKLVVSGLQHLALAVLVGVLLTPLINPAFLVTWNQRIAATVIIGVSEGVALYLIGLIPNSEE